MKKGIMCFAILSVIVLSCSGCESQAKRSVTVVQAVKKTGICNVSIDPKVELLGVVQYLADDSNILKDNLSNLKDAEKYSDDISNYFSKYKDEPVVSLYKDIRSKGFSYDCPPRVMLYVDSNFKLLDNIVLPDDIIKSAGGKDILLKFLNLLSDLKNKSKFDEFYISHTNFYNNIVINVKDRVDKIGCVENLIEFYGYKQNSFNIIIQPLSIGGYAGWTSTKDGKLDVYDFMVVPNDDVEFSNLLVHEFGHSYINPLTQTNINIVNKYNNLFTPIRESMSKQAYGSWDTCVNEHIVRAITYKILYNLFSTKVSQSYIDRDTASNFIYIKALSESLEEYKNNRDKYPTIKDFYPGLLNEFQSLSNNITVK